jgi:protein TonB
MGFFSEQDRDEWITLAAPQPARRRRWGSAMSSSALVHIAIVAGLFAPVAPIFVSPRLVAHGEGGNAAPATAIALYVPSDLRAAIAPKPAALTLPTAPRPENPQKSAAKKRMNALAPEHPAGDKAAGSPSGTSYVGLTYGDEVKPALPSVFPDLKIHRDDLPDGVQGDVVIEVTIDTQGNVIEEKLLQGIGHGVDERAIAVVRDWRFRPATRNGVPIPSKHDVHFHFPS